MIVTIKSLMLILFMLICSEKSYGGQSSGSQTNVLSQHWKSLYGYKSVHSQPSTGSWQLSSSTVAFSL